MITLVTLHVVHEPNRDQALWLLRRNTELARRAPGFVSREVLFSRKDPSRGYSITTWESEADLDRFLRSPERPPLLYEGEETRVYLETPEGRVLLFSRTDSDRYEALPALPAG
jgi:heme-degrading monooxygenase HmoA